MDFLNKSMQQLRDLFSSMSPGSRITTALLLVVVVVSVGWLFSYQVRGGNDYLLNGHRFSTSEATAAEAALSKAGLTDWSFDGTRIKVPAARHDAYVAALVDGNALPRDIDSPIEKDATSTLGPFASKDERERVMKIAVQQKLALIIRKMQGIENAVVSYDMQVSRGLKRERTTTASVGVKTVGAQPLDGDRVQAIRHLVASSIAGMTAKDVTVADLSSGKVWAASTGDPLGSAMDDAYLQRKRQYESDFEGTIQRALSYVPGATVGVLVQLDPTSERTEQGVKIENKNGAVVRTSETNSTKSQEGAPPAGPPGVGANAANRAERLSSGGPRGSTSQQEQGSREEQSIFPQSQHVTKMVGLTPERVTVAIGIPSTYFLDVWRQRNPPEDGKQAKDPTAAQLTELERMEIEKIRDHVRAVLPVPKNTLDTSALVTVTKFERLAGATIPEPGIASMGLVWLSNYWSTLAMLGLGLFSLLVLRSMLKAQPAPLPSASLSMAGMGAADAGASGGANAAGASGDEEAQSAESRQNRLKRRGASGPTLRDELVEVVKEDPDTAAKILRAWIGNVN